MSSTSWAPRRAGAPPEQRDALRLLAAFVQHTDNKVSNQRLVCLPKEQSSDAPPGERCRAPFMYVHDLGSTFGRGWLFDARGTGSANFKQWSRVPLWHDRVTCKTRLGGDLTFLPWAWSADHYTLGSGTRRRTRTATAPSTSGWRPSRRVGTS